MRKSLAARGSAIFSGVVSRLALKNRRECSKDNGCLKASEENVIMGLADDPGATCAVDNVA